MKPFTTIISSAAVLKIDNIDTDMIIPKQFLKTITRLGLGEKLFFEMRYLENDLSKKNPDFVLNKEEFSKSQILIAGDNFGCGSSREHAPWSLADFGIFCVIATSFADIFYNNCFENSILPIILDQDKIDSLTTIANTAANFKIDLENQTISTDTLDVKFDIDKSKKTRLIKGLDSIGLTMEKMPAIKGFEAKNQALCF
jgi:3-isopropylmalate/(R)-2-methylmalate dehydratase small subunit